MRATIRAAAVAFTTGAAIALFIDAVLSVLMGAIRVTGGAGSLWLGRVLEHSRWIGFGLILWLASPLLAAWVEETVPQLRNSRLHGSGRRGASQGHHAARLVPSRASANTSAMRPPSQARWCRTSGVTWHGVSS